MLKRIGAPVTAARPLRGPAGRDTTATRHTVSELLPVFLLLALLPLNHALAGVGEPGAQLLTTDTDLGRFWWGGLSRLEECPPQLRMNGENSLLFRGLNGRVCRAWIAGARDAKTKVLHLVDAPAPGPVPSIPGCAQLSFAWRDGTDLDTNTMADAGQHPVYEGIVNACRLTRLACGMGTGANQVGLVGEGYGGAIALAVAALMPEYVAFVVAHQPICLSPALFEDEEDAVKAALTMWQMRRLQKRLSARTFAPFVSARALVTLGTEDRYATPDTVWDLYDHLGGEKRMWLMEGVGHCSATQVEDWTRVWPSWAFSSSSAS